MAYSFSRDRVQYPLTSRIGVVHEVEHLAGIYRVHIDLPEETTIKALGPTDHLKIFVADDPSRRIELPQPHAGQRPQLPPGVVSRDVTIREVNGSRLIFDVVNHRSGPLIDWVRNVRPGMSATTAGPRGSLLAPAAPRLFMCVDASALPAAARWLECTSAEKITLVTRTSGIDIAQYLGSALAKQNVTWYSYDDQAPARHIIDRLAGYNFAEHYVWCAGEAQWLIPIRRWLRTCPQLSHENISVEGYWKLGVSGHDHHAQLDPEE
ncbi:siderophore-interacting protein [Trueperella sp. LYQ143]|uniref:siderophore-interacting protein n=1 Tax=Trueperella sp. LYQ143 TaxID=3391059 RepID=UPI003983CE80